MLQLMKEPALQEWRCLQPIARALLEKLRDSSSTVRQMAARGLGNLVSGAPEKVRGALLRAKRSPARPERCRWGAAGGLERVGRAAEAAASLCPEGALFWGISRAAEGTEVPTGPSGCDVLGGCF